MGRRSSFDILTIQTSNIMSIWKKNYQFAPNNAARKLDLAMLDWLSELTKTLRLWIDKGLDMTDGELILARANLGAVVESWLRFFYCVYYDDYIKQPMKNKQGRIIEPENEMRFEDLKKFSTGILWDNENSKDYLWVNSIQKKRNAIHSFTYRDIGTSYEFLNDVDYLSDFVNMIIDRLPSLED